MEYACPARGPWNIVHIGMLVPEAHQIFVCAECCLRGVILTAAEMGARERFSTVNIQEHDVLEGDMERLIIDGVNDVLRKLKYKPRAVLIFTSCIHHFMGCDFTFVYKKLGIAHPDIDFAQCYMNPIMRKTMTPADPMLRRRMYELVHSGQKRDRGVNIVGNLFEIDSGSELSRILAECGRPVRNLLSMKTYDEFQTMGKSEIGIAMKPTAKEALSVMGTRLGQKTLYLPSSYDASRIREQVTTLCSALSVPLPDMDALEQRALRALDAVREQLADWTLALDYTASTAPLSLAKLLLERGFALRKIFIDDVAEPELKAWIQNTHPEVEFLPTTNPRMVFYAPSHRKDDAEHVLCIGQKSAYFTHSSHFVNIMEDDGLYGFGGIERLAQLMTDAAVQRKDTKAIVQIKGWGSHA